MYYQDIGASRNNRMYFLFLFCAFVIVILYFFNFESINLLELQNPYLYVFGTKLNNELTDTNETDDTVSILYSKVKILCLINSSKKEILNRAIHVNATWAKRCNKHVFLTYDENIDLPFLDLIFPGTSVKIPETRRNLWEKWRAAMKWASENELNNYDFFLRADDDAYFIMENLRFMLLPYDPNKAYVFGERFKVLVDGGYLSGGAGVVYTKEALRRLAAAFYNPSICPEVSEGEDDVEIGACAKRLNITIVDTRDRFGRHRMLPWSPDNHLRPGLNSDQMNYLFYPYDQKGFKCCAEQMISFHYVHQNLIYIFEFLIYHVNAIKTFDDVLKESQNLTQNWSTLDQLRHASISSMSNSSTFN